jgi:hypothetical protein
MSRKRCQQDLQSCASLEEIHGHLSTINALLWRQLRTGVLSGCHALLYTVVLCELGEKLGWRDVNRKAVAALHHFTSAVTESERCTSLEDALNCVNQKLAIAKHAGLQKAETLERDEKEAIFEGEAEILRLFRLLRSSPHWRDPRRGQEGFNEMGVYPLIRKDR